MSEHVESVKCARFRAVGPSNQMQSLVFNASIAMIFKLLTSARACLELAVDFPPGREPAGAELTPVPDGWSWHKAMVVPWCSTASGTRRGWTGVVRVRDGSARAASSTSVIELR